MNRRQAVADALAECVARLDVVLKPWGFTFISEQVGSSHTGPYASGHYCRDATRIAMSCRETIDNLYYQHSFAIDYPCHSEVERFTLDHDTFMRLIGHAHDYWLFSNNESPGLNLARDAASPVEALIHDLELFAAPVLRQPCDEFDAIMRRGIRAVSIGKRSDRA